MVEVLKTIRKLHGIPVGLKFYFSVWFYIIITITLVAGVGEDTSSSTITRST